MVIPYFFNWRTHFYFSIDIMNFNLKLICKVLRGAIITACDIWHLLCKLEDLLVLLLYFNRLRLIWLGHIITPSWRNWLSATLNRFMDLKLTALPHQKTTFARSTTWSKRWDVSHCFEADWLVWHYQIWVRIIIVSISALLFESYTKRKPSASAGMRFETDLSIKRLNDLLWNCEAKSNSLRVLLVSTM